MTRSKEFTVEYIAELLLKHNAITPEERTEISIKADTQRARLFKAQEAYHAKGRAGSVAEMVSPSEVIASFGFEIKGSGGKPLSEDFITEVIAKDLQMPYKRIDPLKLDMDLVTSKVPRAFAQKHLVIPVDETPEGLILAVADPFNMDAVESIRRTSKEKIIVVLSSKSDIIKIVREFYGFRSSVMAASEEAAETLDLSNLEQFVKLKGSSDIDASDQHVINAVDFLMTYAYEQRASDIHIEPKREKTLVRLRIDGVLHNVHTIPRKVHPSVVSRIKMLSRMDISEKRRPQDGRIKTEFRGKTVELRISTLPTAFGEKIVIRIFDPDILFQELKDLGFYDREYDLLMGYLNKTYGIILVTGPTGSGKTTTLYSALKKISTPEVNIVTVEDPIEMVMEEFNQVAVQHQLGLDFASTLRTILRQDPDVIMVGEIRDPETANNAIQSALTGHLVLSTLHTNDAPSSVSRLMDLGVPYYLISSTVLGIMAQRLVRKICKHCKTPRKMKPEEITNLELPQKEYTIYYGEGCTDCRSTGYKGRSGIYELMNFSPKIKANITLDTDLEVLRKIAKEEGMITLRECALKKLFEGATTYEEIISIT
ncbi:MAG: type II/IV secretion system protein [Deltaproteobacteria bacterium]|nr:type II/IV secretion system protein [Deltaproteobacteria bacterium]